MVKIQSFWIFQRRDNNEWDALEEEKYSDLPGDIIAGSLKIMNATNRVSALKEVISIEGIIRRIFNETLEYDNEYIYHKWFGGEEDE